MPPRSLLLTSALATVALGGPLLVPPASASDTANHRELAYDDSRFEEFRGLDLHHTVHGAPGATTLLLSHHFYGSAPTWRRLVAQLESDHRLVAFDRPGFGLTERPERDRWGEVNPYSRGAAALLGWDLLDHLEVEDAVLVGSSAGGTNALEMYLLHPERVRALVLLSPAITGDVGPPNALRPLLRSPQARRIAPHLIQRFVGEVDVARTASSWADPSRATPEDAEPYQRMLRVEGWDRGFWEVINASPRPNLSEVLADIEVPVLVVSGDSDTVIRPTWNRRTAAAIPGARYVELEGCGHTPQEECPGALASTIEAFLTDAGVR